jgi:hypothetical protein
MKEDLVFDISDVHWHIRLDVCLNIVNALTLARLFVSQLLETISACMEDNKPYHGKCLHNICVHENGEIQLT